MQPAKRDKDRAYNGVDVVRGPLGKPGSAEHQKFVNDVWTRWNWYRQQTIPIYEVVERMWRLYMCKGEDPRGPDEKWRANIQPSIAYSNIETMVASVVSILTSADPLIQPEAVSDADLERARSVERVLDYTYRKNSVVKFLTKIAREKYVAGTSFFKTTWGEFAHVVQVNPKPGQPEALQEAIQQAVAGGAPDPPDWMTAPEDFMKWRELVNSSGKAKVPEPPYGGPKTVVRYRGPVFQRLPIWAVVTDPLIDDMQDQNFVVHRMVKPRSWIEQRTKAGYYDRAAVDAAFYGWDGRIMLEWEQQLAAARGLVVNSDPYYYDSCELFEVWQQDTEVPYAIIMNRSAVINKNPYTLPYDHGECAISAVRHVVVPGQFYGLSAIQPVESLLDEWRKLRNLRADGATLNVMPVFVKLREAGIPDLARKIKPGSIMQVSRVDALQALKKDPMPPEAWREPAEIVQEIADAMQIYDSTKGAPAQVGRVTGTEFQGRTSQAQLRIKLDALFMEEDLIPSVHQALSLWGQMSDAKVQVKVGGQPNPFVELSCEDFVEALDMQFRFRGATKAINRDMQVQQLLLLADKFGAVMLPQELRLLARLVLELEDIRGASRVISEEGTQEKTQDYEMQRQAAVTQLQMQITQGQAQQAPTPGGQAPQPPPQPPQGGGGNEQGQQPPK